MRQKNDQACEAEGKSCGGLSTKIQAAVDALGNPVRLSITEGQSSEYGQANALIEGFEAEFILADKGYDSDAFVQSVSDSGAVETVQKTNYHSRTGEKQKPSPAVVSAKETVQETLDRLRWRETQPPKSPLSGGLVLANSPLIRGTCTR